MGRTKRMMLWATYSTEFYIRTSRLPVWVNGRMRAPLLRLLLLRARVYGNVIRSNVRWDEQNIPQHWNDETMAAIARTKCFMYLWKYKLFALLIYCSMTFNAKLNGEHIRGKQKNNNKTISWETDFSYYSWHVSLIYLCGTRHTYH